MRIKKKAKKKKLQDTPLLSSDEERSLEGLLGSIKDIEIHDLGNRIGSPQLAQLFLEKLPADDPGAVDLIMGIKAAFSQKNVQKAVRKALFRFRQRGISIPEFEEQKDVPTILRKTESAEVSAYLGSIDGFGNRGVLLILPRFPQGVDLGMGMVNDEEGIIEFLFDTYSKKRMREIKEQLLESFDPLVETSLPHAATILEKSYSKSEPGLNESSEGYLQLRPRLLESVALLDHPIIYDFIPSEEISGDILTPGKIQKLLSHELLKLWIIHPDRMKPLVEEILKAEESPIHISEDQKAMRLSEIKEKGMREIYTETQRLIQRERLEEMAYLFFRRDEEDYARLSLAAALTMVEKDSSFLVNPFQNAMVERSLDFYLQEDKGAAESGGAGQASPSRLILP